MIEGRITRIGDSWGVVLPKRLREQIRWFPGDTLLLDPTSDGLLLRNSTQHDVAPISRRKSDDHRTND